MKNVRAETKLTKLDPMLTKGSFYGFVLQKDYWYGYNQYGSPIATSGWVYNGFLCLYVLDEHNTWKTNWVPLEECREAFPEFYKEYRKAIFQQRRAA